MCNQLGCNAYHTIHDKWNYEVAAKRLSEFLVQESAIEESETLKITHEVIANHLGSHREVITRMLKYFQNEGWVSLSRGAITITDFKALQKLYDE